MGVSVAPKVLDGGEESRLGNPNRHFGQCQVSSFEFPVNLKSKTGSAALQRRVRK